MQPFIWDRRPDGLRAPAMVCAFQGWNDAGDAASSAVSFLADALGARRFARIDSEEFYDFQANRPCVRFGENEKREISWPSVEVFEAPAPRAQRDLVLVQGVEPSMRWRSFSSQIVDLAEALGVQVVVSLGAQLIVVQHALEQMPQRRVVDLAREVLEETVELIQIAVGAGQETRRVSVDPSCRRDLLHVYLQLVA